jgi:predicted component of type VI protein secretion system
VSRFARYLKVIIRDQIGGFMLPSGVERALNQWIRGYVSSAGQDADAGDLCPFREGRVDVIEVAGRSGDYNAVIHLYRMFTLETERDFPGKALYLNRFVTGGQFLARDYIRLGVR